MLLGDPPRDVSATSPVSGLEYSVRYAKAARCSRSSNASSDNAASVSLAFVPGSVTASVPLFVSLEVAFIDTLRRLCLLAFVRHWAFVAVFRMETIIYMATEVARAMKPWAGADEYVPAEPFRAIVTRGSATIGSGVIVTVGTFGGYTDIDADLSNCPGGDCHEATAGNGS